MFISKDVSERKLVNKPVYMRCNREVGLINLPVKTPHWQETVFITETIVFLEKQVGVSNQHADTGA